MMQHKKKVLIICGGGVFGCIPAHLLGSLPYQYNYLNKVDLISGCSIGGILATLYAAGKPFKQVDQKFTQLADKCFTKRFIALLNPLACPKYRSDGLFQSIQSMIGTLRIGNIREIYPDLDFVIPTLDVTNNKYKVYDNIVKDADDDKLLSYVALQTASAPSYFQGQNSNGNCIIDGGLVQVAPLLTATTALKGKRGIPFKDMDVLMIGVGTQIDRPKMTPKRYNSLNLLELATDVIVPYTTEANQLATTYWGKNLGLNSFTYYNPCKISGGLDDVSRIEASIREADKYAEEFKEVYIKWLQS